MSVNYPVQTNARSSGLCRKLESLLLLDFVILAKISTREGFWLVSKGGRVKIVVHFLDIPNSNGYFLTSSLVSGVENGVRVAF